MPRKNKKGKSKKGKDPKSSTPETSINSVDDDTQQLLRSGAGASTDGSKSRVDEKTKKDSRWSLHRNPSPYQSLDATSSKNSPQSGHYSAQYSTDPESSASPSKKHSFSPLRKFFEKKTPNRSPGTECSCEVGNHKPECPKSKNLPVDQKGAFGGAITKTFSAKKDEDSTKSSSSFGGVKPKKLSAEKNNDGTQSSSSSNPSVAEYFASASESQLSSERSLLLDPNRGAEVHSTRPSKKATPTTRMSDKFKTKKQVNRSSGTESSFEEKTNEELKCPEQRKHKMDQRNKSLKGKLPNPKQTTSKTTSSSGPSTSTENINSDASYELPRCLNSKSSTKSDPKGKRPLKGPSGNKSSNESKSNTEASSISTDSNRFEELFRRATLEEGTQKQAIGGNEPKVQDDKILIDQMDVERRDPSRGLISHLPEPKLEIPFDPNNRQYNFREMNVRIKEIEWKWLEERRRKAQEAKNKAKEEKDRKKEDSAVDKPDENERELIREAVKIGPAPSIPRIRHDSSSPVRVRPCNCGADQGRRVGHHITCVKWRDLRRRFRKRKNRFA